MFDVSKVKRLGAECGINAYSYQGDLGIDELKQFKTYIKEMEVTKMTKKFTEEQYQKIVELQKLNYKFSILEERFGESFWRSLIKFSPDVAEFSHKNNLIDELAALANPLTRGWAHDKFVEKEKKYVWSSKKADRDSNVLTLYIDDYGMVSTSYRKVYEKNLHNENMLITETEIKEWGYNPEMFDKEEV